MPKKHFTCGETRLLKYPTVSGTSAQEFFPEDLHSFESRGQPVSIWDH